MSSIALIIKELGPQSAKATSLLFKELGISLAVTSVATDSQRPVMIKRLFDRTDPGFAERLVSVLQKLDGLGCRWTAIELPDNQTYSPEGRYFEITPDRLRNMIEDRAESLEEQRRLMELESPENDEAQ